MGDTDGTQLSVRVVRSLADARNVEPTELGFRLGNAIDVDALDAMATHDGASWQLSFEVAGLEVAPDEPVVVDGTEYR